MYITSKTLEIVISNLPIHKDGRLKLSVILDRIIEVVSVISRMDNDIDNANMNELISDLDKKYGESLIEVGVILARANRIAHKEWLSKILLYHFVIALCFHLDYETDKLDRFISDELMYVPIESRYVNPSDIVNSALTTPLHYIKKNIDNLANALSIHNSVTVRGPKGCGKKSTILGLIKAITLKQYPLLYNSNILINPSKQIIDMNTEQYKGAHTICIITATSTENLFPRPSWLGVKLSEQLKFVYVIDDENKAMENAVSVISPFIATEIRIEAPEREDIEKILLAHTTALQAYIGLSYEDEVISYIVQAAERFDNKSNQPVKSINLLMEVLFDEINVGARELTGCNITPSSMIETSPEEASEVLKTFRDVPISRIVSATSRSVELTIASVETFIVKRFNLSPEVLASMMSTNIREHLKGLKDKILTRVYGQNEAVDSITRALWRRGLKLDPMVRPTSFLFIGATGTGKTWTAKVLAEYLLGGQDRMERFDMSEYMERHEVSKLIGSPPGYVGSNQPGRLTEVVLKNPHAVLLFDEIEKAHRDIMNIFLQILDDGRLTDNQGRTIDFSKTIIIMTSNVGTDKAYSAKGPIGFDTQIKIDNKPDIMKKEAEKEFKPEFLNRIDKIIVYNTLADAEFIKIIRTRLSEIQASSVLKIKYNNIRKLAEYLLSKAKEKPYNIGKYNAREIKRVIIETIESGIIDFIDKNDTKSITIDDKLEITK